MARYSDEAYDKGDIDDSLAYQLSVYVVVKYYEYLVKKSKDASKEENKAREKNREEIMDEIK